MTLRRLTRGRLGIPVSDDFFTDSVVDDHINLAVQAIEGEYHWPWADAITRVTITPTAPSIPYPTNYRATRAVFDGEIELQQVSPIDLLTWTKTAAEVPRVWCPMVDEVVVAPTVQANRQLAHYWYRQPVWLRLDDDIPDMPDQFTGALVAKAAELLSSREGAGSDAGRHGSEYSEWLNRMRRDVRRTTTPTRVRVRPGGWI